MLFYFLTQCIIIVSMQHMQQHSMQNQIVKHDIAHMLLDLLIIWTYLL